MASSSSSLEPNPSPAPLLPAPSTAESATHPPVDPAFVLVDEDFPPSFFDPAIIVPDNMPMSINEEQEEVSHVIDGSTPTVSASHVSAAAANTTAPLIPDTSTPAPPSADHPASAQVAANSSTSITATLIQPVSVPSMVHGSNAADATNARLELASLLTKLKEEKEVLVEVKSQLAAEREELRKVKEKHAELVEDVQKKEHILFMQRKNAKKQQLCFQE